MKCNVLGTHFMQFLFSFQHPQQDLSMSNGGGGITQMVHGARINGERASHSVRHSSVLAQSSPGLLVSGGACRANAAIFLRTRLSPPSSPPYPVFLLFELLCVGLMCEAKAALIDPHPRIMTLLHVSSSYLKAREKGQSQTSHCKCFS